MIPSSPLEILNGVIQVAQRIYKQVELVKSNKKRWSSLVDLIKTIISSVEGLTTLPKQANFAAGLQSLESQIMDASIFLESMIGMKYLERFAKAGRHQKKIDGYRADILELIPVLSLGLNAQQLVGREQDGHSELADREAFVREQEQQLFRRQADNFKQQRDLEEVMRQQMQAFKEDLIQNWQPEPPRELAPPPLPEQLMVKLYDITFEEKLTSSRLGMIHRGRWKGQEVLVKWIEGPLTPSDKNQFIREAKIMSRLHHNHIVPFYGACFEENQMCIVTGVVAPLSLDRLSRLSFTERLTLGKELARGLVYLHANEVIHSSIHPENVGITQRGEGKWMDLSWVKTQLSSLASIGVAHEATVWQAPETWGERSKVTPEADVYSLGWLLWTLITGQLPFSDQPCNNSLLQQLEAGRIEAFANDCPRNLANLITRCWDQNPQSRPKLSEVIDSLDQALLRPASPTGEAYYEQGKEAQKAGDFSTAFECYTRSAEKHYTKSYNSLGFFALQGEGGQLKDLHKAKSYFERAAKADYAPAMFNLGRMYEKGTLDDSTAEGQPREAKVSNDLLPQSNVRTALAWYEKAKQADPKEVRYQGKVEKLTQALRMLHLC